ncbi:MAG: hypothetical protein IJV40_04370 [Oscillospiraceae bacterium]|nr:hypothetical protein [Oscillospiraceae bacterium]
MTNYREILRMNSLGFNKTEIAQSLHCSRTTVRAVIRLAEEQNLQYPLPEGMSDKDLYDTLYPTASGKMKYKMPDYEHVYKELQRDGVTLDLLWREYVDECRLVHIAVFPGQQGNNSRPVRATTGGQRAACKLHAIMVSYNCF